MLEANTMDEEDDVSVVVLVGVVFEGGSEDGDIAVVELEPKAW